MNRNLFSAKRLSPEEERALVVCIQAANEEIERLKGLAANGDANEWLTKALSNAEKRASDLKWTLVNDSMRYMCSLAVKYRRGRTTLDELVSEGYMYLLKLAGRFRHRPGGGRFISYAGKCLRYHFWYVQGLTRTAGRVKRARSRELLPGEFATSGTILDEVIERESGPKTDVLAHFQNLRPQVQEVLTRKLGLDGSQGASLREIGRDLQLMASTVQYMQLSGLKRLRKELV